MATEPNPCPRCGKPPRIHCDESEGYKLFSAIHECEPYPAFSIDCREASPTRDKAVMAWNAWLEGMKK